ncbi:MAG: flagellar export protein FliJ [Phycisphaerales bacterium]|nr:flagellar export protein FliJ [Phycisphaerales bacterium]
MARFRFRLQPVLEHRRTLERERQRNVAAIELERLDAENTIRAIQAEVERENRELRATLSSGDFRMTRAHAARIAQLHADARRRVLHLSGVLARLDAARAELLGATRRRKAVELLRDRRLEEWRLAESRREAAAVDEISVIRGNPAAEAAP